MDKEKFNWIKNYLEWFVYRFSFIDSAVALYLVCLAALESDFGNSVIARENRNLVGMRVSRKRLSTCRGENGGFAVYPTVYSSLCDLMYWFGYYGYVQSDFSSLDKFLRKFKKHFIIYSCDKNYMDKIDSIFESYIKFKN